MGMAKVWEEKIVIPTYPVGKEEKNPMFIDKRVYQGSSGKVYPYPTIETINDIKEDVVYKAVYLENDYLKVMVLPELGGRIQRAYDKTNDYDFIYYNHVMKPALVGLLGPWVSGGIEFNWPQHHRPTTFMAVDHTISENTDGSVSVLCNDTDRIYGTKGICKITLYPDTAYIEITGQLHNRTSLPETFLWWANPAVPVNEYTKTIMPPDVNAVMDHGKRDVSRFPIATGTYYKKDYSEGVDISRYKNIPVPTSLMAASSKYDFVGGYDYNVQAGILHVADHHFSPGKKQWTWGCGDFGRMWDKNLTDADGPYVELMTGVYTDNQPDFTWLKPFEEKTFKQYFMPYKKVGNVKNATKKACVGMEVTSAGLHVTVYATSEYENTNVTVKIKDETVFCRECTISPNAVFDTVIEMNALQKSLLMEDESNASIRVMQNENVLVFYNPETEKIPEIPMPAEAAKDPSEIMNNEELLLTGRHIEQYRHATYLPDPYYLEGLKRDSGDSNINCAYGMLLLRRGRAELAEPYFRTAIKRLTERNPNPYHAEAYYDLGLCLLLQGNEEEAYDAFYKATWTAEQQNPAFYYLAVMDCRKGKFDNALEMIEKSLIRNSHNIKARALKAVLLRKLGLMKTATEWITLNLEIDPFDYVSAFEALQLGETSVIDETELVRRNRGDLFNLLRTAGDYAEAGFYTEALNVLKYTDVNMPLTGYYKAYYSGKLGNMTEALAFVKEAEKAKPDYCFPNALADIAVLKFAVAMDAKASMAMYYLGNLFYDKAQWELALELWEKSVAINAKFPTALRNLSLIYYNKCGDADKAKKVLEKAFRLDETDARIFLELDQLHKKTGYTFAQRLKEYEKYSDVFVKRDDLCVEYCTILNAVNKPAEAYAFMIHRKFHPWEGGEGKITAQYEFSLLLMAIDEINKKEYAAARDLLEKALAYPENLGEGRLEGTRENHIYYYLGLVNELLGDADIAETNYVNASFGTDEPAGMVYYYDQPADMIMYQGFSRKKKGDIGGANKRFYRLVDYGERHLKDHVKIDFFAVSLPDFLTFEDDLDVRNEAHCYFLMSMGHAGLGNQKKAKEYMREALKRDPMNYRMVLINHILNVTNVY